MKKLFTALFILLFCLNIQTAHAKGKNDFASVIKNSGIDKTSVGISFKSADTGKPIYELNEKILFHPASVQKIMTTVSAVDILGEDYEFTTTLYKKGDNSYLIKLGGDPYLTSGDLKQLVNGMNAEVKTVCIDDSVLEKKDWGEGWQWDDDMNVLMPRFNSYNLDKNLAKITVMPSEETVSIINPSKYPFVFINNVIIGEKNNIKITRGAELPPNTLLLEGTISKPFTAFIPINNLKQYFNIKLKGALAERKIYLKDGFALSKYNNSDTEIDKITHPLTQAVKDVFHNSNNMVSETVFRLAGGKAYNGTGTDIYGIKVFEEYCKKLGLDNSKIRIADSSGVSKNNLSSADFITEYLVKTKDNALYDFLPAPGEGTLTHRMLPLKDNLKAKTGTLGDSSSIAGFLTSKSGNKYVFCIIINDTASTISDMKMLENYLIREAYLRL